MTDIFFLQGRKINVPSCLGDNFWAILDYSAKTWMLTLEWVGCLLGALGQIFMRINPGILWGQRLETNYFQLSHKIHFPGDGCVDKPLSTLWRNHISSDKPDIVMKMTVVGSGLRAVTKEHGLTEYWANRITYCTAHPSYPRVFCWIYR